MLLKSQSRYARSRDEHDSTDSICDDASAETETCLETRISVVIPTYGRPATLRDAIKSVAEQSIEPSRIQLIIIDNNPTDQERQAIASLEHLFANPIIYFHEPNAGLCNARNAGMAQVKSRYVAFLDDDMIASSSWLSSLLESTSRLGAGIVFGPTLARLPEDIPDPNGFMSRFFSRVLKNEKEKRVEKTLGAGGCLLDLSLCRLPKPAFDPALNTHGGEDDVLFEMLKRQGTLVGWSPDALSHEIVPRHRANAHYVVQTSFGFGQGPAQIYATRRSAGSLKIAFTMAKGGVQLLLHGVLAFFAFVRRSPTSLRHMSRATQGLGKIFWGKRFSLNLYAPKNIQTISKIANPPASRGDKRRRHIGWRGTWRGGDRAVRRSHR